MSPDKVILLSLRLFPMKTFAFWEADFFMILLDLSLFTDSLYCFTRDWRIGLFEVPSDSELQLPRPDVVCHFFATRHICNKFWQVSLYKMYTFQRCFFHCANYLSSQFSLFAFTLVFVGNVWNYWPLTSFVTCHKSRACRNMHVIHNRFIIRKGNISFWTYTIVTIPSTASMLKKKLKLLLHNLTTE